MLYYAILYYTSRTANHYNLQSALCSCVVVQPPASITMTFTKVGRWGWRGAFPRPDHPRHSHRTREIETDHRRATRPSYQIQIAETSRQLSDRQASRGWQPTTADPDSYVGRLALPLMSVSLFMKIYLTPTNCFSSPLNLDVVTQGGGRQGQICLERSKASHQLP